MKFRTIAAVVPLLLASCDFFYGVRRKADVPWTIDPLVLEQRLRAMPGFREEYPWDGCVLAHRIERVPAAALVAFGIDQSVDGGGLEVSSCWVGHVPDDAVLAASFALQAELLQVLAAQVPGFPTPAAFRIDWMGLDNPRGEQLAAAKARLEAASRTR